MPRVFSPKGFNVLYFPKLNILNHGFYGLRDFTDVFSDTVSGFWCAFSRGFESGFTGFRGL
jgi:hypothetical protein